MAAQRKANVDDIDEIYDCEFFVFAFCFCVCVWVLQLCLHVCSEPFFCWLTLSLTTCVVTVPHCSV